MEEFEQAATVKKRNEEVTDILERMPTKFGRWIAIAIVIFTILLLTFGWIIKYPDVVSGQVIINSSLSPVKLVAGSSGKIRLNGFVAREQVRENDYIAIIQNSANTADIKKIAELIQGFDLNRESYIQVIDSFPEKVSLGELNLKYFSFLTAMKNMCSYEKENVYEQQKRSLNDYIKWQNILLQQTGTDTLTSKEKLLLIQKWLTRKEGLYKKDMVTEKEFDDMKSEFLNSQSADMQLHKAITTIRVQISEATGKLNQLKTEQAEREQQMHLALLSSYNDLLDNIKAWEQKYVFKAPFDGQVEFLQFWANDQFVEVGKDVFSIVPQQHNVIGQMTLPAGGAGKVKIDSKVIIKLDNYPYMEYGSVEGIVSTISLISKQQQAATGSVDTYLVGISLPQGLHTNYGKKLDFRYEIKGQADIIVNDRRLIERLFDNLKYRTK